MLEKFLIGLFCFILFLILHIIIFHQRSQIRYRFRLLEIIFFSIFPIYLFYLFLAILIPEDILGPIIFSDPIQAVNVMVFLNGLLVYVFLFLGYCQFYFIVDRSISVRIMIELETSPEKQLTLEDIRKVYDLEGIWLRRLGHMADGRYIIKDGDYYKNTRKGSFEARLFKFLKEFLRLGPGG